MRSFPNQRLKPGVQGLVPGSMQKGKLRGFIAWSNDNLSSLLSILGGGRRGYHSRKGEGYPNTFSMHIHRPERQAVGFSFTNVQDHCAQTDTSKKGHKIVRSLSLSVYLGRHWGHSCDETSQAFFLQFCVLQVITTRVRSGNKCKVWSHKSCTMLIWAL